MRGPTQRFLFPVPSTAVAVLISGAVASATFAGGFDTDGQSAHAMGLGGAYTAAPATPSSLFYNVGAAAFLAKQAHAVGAFYPGKRDFSFTQPPAFGQDTGFEDSSDAVLPHAYTVHPIKKRKIQLNLGVAIYSPFHHEVDWSEPNTFPGRFDTVSTQLRTLDLQTSLSLRLGNFGIGAGVIVRAADFEHTQRLQTRLADGSAADFAELAYDSGQQEGFGWTLGLLHRPSEWFSWGVSYRSEIEVDFSPEARLTQIATGDDDLDQVLRLTQPFGQDLPGVFSLTFPASLSAGITVGDWQRLALSLAVKRTEWSELQELDLDVISLPIFDEFISLALEDSHTYSAAAQYKTRQGTELRLGYSFDEGAQPISTMGAFLYDPDKIIVSAGVGRDWLDIGLRWVNYKDEDVILGSDILNPGELDILTPGELAGEEFLLTVTLKKTPKLKLPIF